MNTRYLYILVWPGSMTIRDTEHHREVNQPAVTPFTTRRLLVGDMLAAAETLNAGIQQLFPARTLWQRFLPPKYRVIIHPQSMTEGGLSMVEKRIFLELTQFIGPKSGMTEAFMCEHPETLTNEQALDAMTGGFKPVKKPKKGTDKIVR